MNTETNFMSFEDLTKLIEEHKKETHPYKRYEFDSTSYTLLLISINNLIKENKKLNGAIQTYDILLKSNVEENKQLKERIQYLERSNNRREDTILEQRQEICDLEDNWNKLKEWFENNIDKPNIKFILEIIQELEHGCDNDGKSDK